jgi:hypothetical protein
MGRTIPPIRLPPSSLTSATCLSSSQQPTDQGFRNSAPPVRGRPLLSADAYYSAPNMLLCPSLVVSSCLGWGQGSLENRSAAWGSGGRGGEGDRVAKALQLVDRAALETSALQLLEIVSAEIGVGLVVTEQVVEDHEHAVRHSQDGFLLAPSTREAVKLSSQIVA